MERERSQPNAIRIITKEKAADIPEIRPEVLILNFSVADHRGSWKRDAFPHELHIRRTQYRLVATLDKWLVAPWADISSNSSADRNDLTPHMTASVSTKDG